MMDIKLAFCDKADAKSKITSNVIDFLQKAPTTGLNDRPLYVVCKFPKALVGTSLTIAIEDSANNSEFKTVVQTGALAPADTTKGLAIQMPVKHRRYVRLVATPSSISDGTMTAYLSDVIEVPTTYKVEGIEFLPGAAA